MSAPLKVEEFKGALSTKYECVGAFLASIEPATGGELCRVIYGFEIETRSVLAFYDERAV